MEHRRELVDALTGPFVERAAELGLAGPVSIAYRPRSNARSAEELEGSCASAWTPTSIAASPCTGHIATTWCCTRPRRDLRRYGSQGQQRLGLLALLLGGARRAARRSRHQPRDAARRRAQRARPRTPAAAAGHARGPRPDPHLDGGRARPGERGGRLAARAAGRGGRREPRPPRRSREPPPRPLADACPACARGWRPRRCSAGSRRLGRPPATEVARHSEPVSERGGVVTVRVRIGVWAAELAACLGAPRAPQRRPRAPGRQVREIRFVRRGTESTLRRRLGAPLESSLRCAFFRITRGKFQRPRAPDLAPNLLEFT